MPAVPADLSVSSRWLLTMNSAAAVLENHTLIVRGGRILDVLPSSIAAERYAAAVHADRSTRLLMPGFVNAYTRIAPAPATSRGLDAGARLCIAEMLASGTTCFCATGFFPAETARAAAEQGMRAVVGIPIAERPSPWAADAGEYLTRALEFRDEYRAHPSIATVFAPQSPTDIGDETYRRMAMLADELDAGIVMPLHESRAAVADCVARHGLRPLERMQSLGLLTPAFTAAHMANVTATDLAVAQRAGIALTLCPEADLMAGNALNPLPDFASTGLRLSLGSGVSPAAIGLDAWSGLRLLGLLTPGSGSASPARRAWDALAVATRGGAAALGLDAQIGSLEIGKWADLCCIELGSPALRRICEDTAIGATAEWVWNGARDLVNDVWIAGRRNQCGESPCLTQAATQIPPNSRNSRPWPKLGGTRKAPPSPCMT